jgi:hypothetical protein
MYGSTDLVHLGCSFSFLIYTQSVGLLGQGISRSQGRYIYTEQHKQNKRTQTPMSRVRFEPTIPAFERAKTVHALDRAVTVIGLQFNHSFNHLMKILSRVLVTIDAGLDR